MNRAESVPARFEVLKAVFVIEPSVKHGHVNNKQYEQTEGK